ncbi:MAG: alpha/beta hydrolase [Pyrinomonadaceae bacterium]
MRKPSCGSILLLLLLLTLPVADAFGQNRKVELKIEPYVFENAAGEKVEAELGKFKVPENRNDPRSRLIELSFVRFKSTAERPGSPIVYLAGGPGGSGSGTARGTRFPLFMAMREVADVIAFDQRGTGMSEPELLCREKFIYPTDKVPDAALALEIYRRESRACLEDFRRKGADLAGYNTEQSADDLEDLRLALGAEKISLWAISYGTHLSLDAIKRHEKSIDRAILAGVEGLQHTIKLPSSIEAHLEHLDRLAKADPKIREKIPSLIGLMKEVLEKVEREPAMVEVTDPVSKEKVKVTVNRFVLQLLTAFAFGSGENALPRYYYEMSKGDFSRVAAQWLRITNSGQPIGSAMSFMMDCYSGISPERRKRVEKEAKTALLGDVMNFPFPEVCTAWGEPDAGEDFRREIVKTKVPTLFISGTLDVRTPPGNAEEVRRGFPDSRHLIIEGAVHSDPLFLSSPQIKEAMLDFMKGKRVSTTRIELEPLRFLPLD